MTLQGIYGNARQINRLKTNVERFEVLRYLCARKQDEIKPPTKGKQNILQSVDFISYWKCGNSLELCLQYNLLDIQSYIFTSVYIINKSLAASNGFLKAAAQIVFVLPFVLWKSICKTSQVYLGLGIGKFT